MYCISRMIMLTRNIFPKKKGFASEDGLVVYPKVKDPYSQDLVFNHILNTIFKRPCCKITAGRDHIPTWQFSSEKFRANQTSNTKKSEWD